MSLKADQIRMEFKASDDIRDAGLTTPEDIVRYDDIVYGEDPKWQSLDVYRPKAAEGKVLPVIVSVHGGGWVYGDKERYQFYCMNLAQRGFAVVNFSYRLAPESKYPAPLEDANAVFTWVLAHAQEYGFDKEHIFAVGDSAGGHLLGLYANICTNPDYAKEYAFQVPEGFAPTAIALNCGAYVIWRERDAELMQDFLPERGTEREYGLIDVLAHITPDFPPTFFMTSNGDFLKMQAPGLAAKLLEQGVPFVYRCYGDKENELQHVFHCNIRTEAARRCNDEECNFFKSYI